MSNEITVSDVDFTMSGAHSGNYKCGGIFFGGRVRKSSVTVYKLKFGRGGTRWYTCEDRAVFAEALLKIEKKALIKASMEFAA